MNTDKANPEASDAAQTPAEAAAAAPADPVATTVDPVAALQAELDEVRNKYLRSLAEYDNFQRRASRNELVAKSEGVARVASSVVGVMDHFDMALVQDPSKATAEQIIAGVRVIREELLKILSQNGVTLITPAKNDEFMPGRHEAVTQLPAEGAESGRVSQLFQAGYLLTSLSGERVLRPAKVAVAP